MQEISEDQVLNRLRAKVSYGKKIKDLADDFGVSAAFMSMVLAGKRPITEPMLKAIGVRRHTVYEAVE